MSSNHRNPVEYATIVFAFVISVFSMVSAGNSFNQHHYAVGISAVLTGLFLTAVLVAVTWSRFQALRDRLAFVQADLDGSQKRLQQALDEARYLRDATQTQNTTAAVEAAQLAPSKPAIDQEIKALIDGLLEPISKSIDEHAHDHEVLRAIVTDMNLIHEDPNPKDFPAITRAFHDQTDRYIQFTGTDGNYSVEFSATPFEPTVSPEVVKSNEEYAAEKAKAVQADKPLTKSQQRRINAQKGKGAFTDAELKEQRNAKRRAAREAKKAAAEKAAESTTTTTTVKE